ncbi:MAG: hypothetical protein ACRDG7_18850 [Candidatus Limnocylindria bacterium]
MAATPQELTYEIAAESIRNQRDRLTGLHTRAATLLAAAALVTSFLGAQALDDTRLIAESGQLVADQVLEFWELLAIAFFVAAAAGCIRLLLPWPGWQFHLNPKKLVRDYVEGDLPATLTEMQRELAIHLRNHYETNEDVLNKRIPFYAWPLRRWRSR